MPVGAEFINDNGRQIIDQDYVSMCFLGKGRTTLDEETIYTGQYGFRSIWSKFGTSTSPNGMIIAFRPVGGAAIGIRTGGWTGSSFFGYQVGSAPQVDWWVFGRPPRHDGGMAGLEIYDPNGQAVYSSVTSTVPVVASVIQSTTPNINVGAGNYALAVGFPMPDVFGTGTIRGDGSGGYLYNEGRFVWTHSNGAFFSQFVQYERRQKNFFPIGSGSGRRATALLLDVSKF